MTWSNRDRTRLVLVAVVAALLVGGENARADFTFGKARILGDSINMSGQDNPLCLSPNGLEMYFSVITAADATDGDIWITRRVTLDDDWGSPEKLDPIAGSPGHDTSVDISADGLTLYIASSRPGGQMLDLWMTTRSSISNPWATPENLGPIVNSPQEEWDPTISPDGLELYFMSNRSGNLGGYFGDIYVSKRVSKSDPWQEPEIVVELSSTHSEGYTCISPNGLTMFLDSDRPGGNGDWDIWFSRRPRLGAPWGPPINLGVTINTSSTEGLGALAPDGRTLYLTTSWAASGGGFADIWEIPIVPLVDFNGDGRVGGVDFTKVVDYWGTGESLCDIGPTPLGDGTVDVQDMIALSAYIGKDIEDPTLVSHWALDETEGNVAFDSAGENHATVMGDAVWQPMDGIVDGALWLDGVDDRIVTEYARDPSEGPVSVFAWVQGGTPGQVIVSQIAGVSWLLADESSGTLKTNLMAPGRRMNKILMSDVVITDGNWHRVGLVWDGTNRSLYVDDVLAATDTQLELVGSGGGLNIGCDKNLSPDSFWSGMIDDVRIYNRAVAP